MRATGPENEIGAIFFSEGLLNIDVSVRTGIPTSELSRIRNGEIRAITANKFYLISLAANIPINLFLKRAYKDLKLANETISTDSDESLNLTSLGAILKPYEDNALLGISFKTGITLKRLKDLSRKKSAVVLAHELFLIEKAIGKSSGYLFNKLFENLKLNSIERQNELRLKENNKS